MLLSSLRWYSSAVSGVRTTISTLAAATTQSICGVAAGPAGVAAGPAGVAAGPPRERE
jgi:hypothetical protein